MCVFSCHCACVLTHRPPAAGTAEEHFPPPLVLRGVHVYLKAGHAVTATYALPRAHISSFPHSTNETIGEGPVIRSTDCPPPHISNTSSVCGLHTHS